MSETSRPSPPPDPPLGVSPKRLQPLTETLEPVSDTDRLISALRDALADLGQKSEENTDRVQKAVDALKPKPVADKETAFWDAYKTLADEHDKEFYQKYSTDLDTSLIFAGLFSAVSSAFIIQIQPELQQDPDDVTQGLLRLLIHNINGSLFAAADTSPPDDGAPIIIVAAQSLLYISLFSTLLAALLAVLGKQWLMHYGEAGNRGTLEERGLERQRKLDGVVKWRFDAVMQMFPLLLQIALLLFSAALSVYLWTINRPIAIISIASASLGTIIYIGFLISAIIYPDSPFQTPLAQILLISARGISNRFPPTVKEAIVRFNDQAPAHLQHWFSTPWAAVRRFMRNHAATPTLPVSHDKTSSPESPALLSNEPFPLPSPAVPAVTWVLETSTNPDLISAAAAMAVDLQWPLDISLDLALKRLESTFRSCFNFEFLTMRIRDDLVERAINCGQAYGVLDIYSTSDGDHKKNLLPYYSHYPRMAGVSPAKDDLDAWTIYFSLSDSDALESPRLAELRSVVSALEGSLKCFSGVREQSTIDWLLRTIPHTLQHQRYHLLGDTVATRPANFLKQLPAEQVGSLSTQSVADYLLCLNVLLDFKPHRHDLATKNKSAMTPLLLRALLNNLTQLLAQNMLDLGAVLEILRMAQLHDDLNSADRSHVYAFCSSLPRQEGWVDVAVAALALQVGSWGHASLHDVNWAYDALEHIRQTFATAPGAKIRWNDAIAHDVLLLLGALIDAQNLCNTPPRVLSVIMEAVSSRDQPRLANLALTLLLRAQFWFHDNSLRVIMEEYSVWSRIGAAVLEELPYLGFAMDYVQLGKELSTIPYWEPYIRADLATWVTLYFELEPPPPEELLGSYNSVLAHIWDTKLPEESFTDAHDAALTFTSIALLNAWKDFKFSMQQALQEFPRLARCTALFAIQRKYEYVPIMEGSSTARREFIGWRGHCSPSLGDTLHHAAENARYAMTNDSKIIKDTDDQEIVQQETGQFLDQAANLLERLGRVLKGERESGLEELGEDKYWTVMRSRFQTELDELDGSQKESLNMAVSDVGS